MGKIRPVPDGRHNRVIDYGDPSFDSKGRKRCQLCGKWLKPRDDGTFRTHKDQATGSQCPGSTTTKPHAHRRMEFPSHKHDSPNGKCHECDRPVSGERKLCGRCLAKRV